MLILENASSEEVRFVVKVRTPTYATGTEEPIPAGDRWTDDIGVLEGSANVYAQVDSVNATKDFDTRLAKEVVVIFHGDRLEIKLNIT